MKKLLSGIFILTIFSFLAFRLQEINMENLSEKKNEKTFLNTPELRVTENRFAKSIDEELQEEAEKNYNYAFNSGTIGVPLRSVVFTNLNVSQDTAPQNEMSVKISKKDPNRVVAAWRDFRLGADIIPVRKIGYSYSTDGGTTWAVSRLLDSTLLPGIVRNSDPAVCEDTSGFFYISTIANSEIQNNQTLAIYKSTDGGVTFPVAKIISQNNDNDKEYICCDWTPGSPYKNSLYICWNSNDTSTGSNNGIFLTRSTDAGMNWSNRVRISPDSAYIGGVDVCVGKNGEVYTCWLKNINMDTYFIKFAKSTNGGLSFEPEGNVSAAAYPEISIAASSFPSIAADISGGSKNGNIYISWTDARYGDPDVFISRSTNMGNSWSSAIRVNNDSLGNGKQQCWPWIAVNDSGLIAIVYVDSRNTSVNTSFEIYLARSSDGGLTFTNTLLSTAQSTSAYPNGAVRFGDYIGIDYWKNRIVPFWTDQRVGGFDSEAYTSIINTLVNIIPISNSVPDKFDLKQNYPNPFNPFTTIEFSLPVSGFVTLKVYDVVGREVTQIINEYVYAGTHRVNWNASTLSNGVYVYKMTAGSFKQSKRMMLVK